ncbi:hypothetical protein qu_195 [Acanthamoeba polyphaga mimivirus]|nr:hypothetical protein [Mimivirus reunion]WMV61533.1 hypothetical protein qu_195 [Mimivirus sp.]WMV62510.1 hypothetical protein qu_195 [Acanthamoeba polyphaga mimivirus]WMV63487.1 hypothetical protein qu_195 [Mimivirus sp.]
MQNPCNSTDVYKYALFSVKRNSDFIEFVLRSEIFSNYYNAANKMMYMLWSFKRPDEQQSLTDNYSNKIHLPSIKNFTLELYKIIIVPFDGDYTKIKCLSYPVHGMCIGSDCIIYLIENVDPSTNCTKFPDEIFAKYVTYRYTQNCDLITLSHNIFGPNITSEEANKISTMIVSDILQSYYKGYKMYYFDNLFTELKYKCHPSDYEKFVRQFIIPKLKKQFEVQNIKGTPLLQKTLDEIYVYMISGY